MAADEAVVVSADRGAVTVMTTDGVEESVRRDLVSGGAGGGVVVGDRVRLGPVPETDADRLVELLPRRSEFARARGDFTRLSPTQRSEHVMAANIDVVVIVVATAHPPFRARQLDGYLVLAEFNDIRPVICLNKSDLRKAIDLAEYERLGYTIVRTSAEEGTGIDDLVAAITGCTSVLVGSSGVGKSSLLNALIPAAHQPISHIGNKSDRGRHTTSASRVFFLDPKTAVIDTPGIRALEMFNISESDLGLYFTDIAALSEDCKFRDCLHTHEPGCAVKAAVAAGALSPARYDSYTRLLARTKPDAH